MFLSHQIPVGRKTPGHYSVGSAPNLSHLRHRIEMAPGPDRLGRDDRLSRIEALIACGAWTDAAIELLAVAAPGWHLQRLCLDGEEWVCTLCRNPKMPDWLDETVECRGSSPALAVVDALMAAN